MCKINALLYNFTFILNTIHLTHTINAAFRRMWLIPSVLGVSWRLAASINNPTLLLGEWVSSEAILRPLSNVVTCKSVLL